MRRTGLVLVAATGAGCLAEEAAPDVCDAWSEQHAIALHLHRAGPDGAPEPAEAVAVLGRAPLGEHPVLLDRGAHRGETLARGDQIVIHLPTGRADPDGAGVTSAGPAGNVFDLAPALSGPTTFQLARGDRVVRLEADLEPGVRYWLAATQLDPTLPFVCHAVAVCGDGGCPPAAPPCCDTQSERRDLVVTSGDIGVDGDWLVIDHPTVRARLVGPSAEVAALEFQYAGRTDQVRRLYSGELRGQVGFKLRARDSCNVAYVMWHIEPAPKIAVSIKRNPGEHDHDSCHVDGYQAMAGEFEARPPAIAPGTSHVLWVALEEDTLRVHADYALVWSGRLSGLPQSGQLGIRSDNARLRWRMLVSDAEPPR